MIHIQTIASTAIFIIVISGGALAKERPPIIDMHMHSSTPDDFGGPQTVCANNGPVEFPPIDPREEATVQKASTCAEPVMSANSLEDNIRRTAEMMKRYNMYGVVDSEGDDLESSLAWQDAWIAAAPGRYIPAIDPSDVARLNFGKLKSAIRDGRIRVFAEISPQYDGELLTSERLDEYFSLAEELDVPVGVHLGEGPPGGASVMPGSRYQVRMGSPLDLEPLLIKYPKLRIYVMHYGSPMTDEMIAILYSYPRVYVDVAQNDWGFPRVHFYAQLKRLVDAGFSKRILFGSDQMIWPDTIPIAIDAIEKAPFLTKAQKRDIFYNNAARFLRLSDDEIARHHGAE
ncbi:MAG: amidohydrolase family protein [Parvularculaceae bacterium]